MSKIWLILHYRDLTLHQNRWHCDCHLLALHNWLQNFTVPNSVEPRCHSPPRLISEPIKSLSPQEFACIPKVSPTSMYLEVIEGKNMSLVCSIEVRSKLNNLDRLKYSSWGKETVGICMHSKGFIHLHEPWSYLRKEHVIRLLHRSKIKIEYYLGLLSIN